MQHPSAAISEGRPQALRQIFRTVAVGMVVISNASTAQTVRSTAPACADITRPTWVLLTGMLGGEGGMKRLESRLVARGHCVVVFDPYALSADSTEVSFDALARRIDVSMRMRNIRAAHVVGHAHGGGVALRLAALYPSRVLTLSLIDVGALPSSRTAIMGRSLSLIPIIAHAPGGKSLIRSKIVGGIRDNSGNASWLDANSEANYVEPVLRNVSRSTAMMQRLAVAQEPESIDALVARVQAPVTVVLGGAPHSTSPTAAHLASLKSVRGCLRVVSVKGAGHFVQEEAPERLAAILDTPCVTRVAGVN